MTYGDVQASRCDEPQPRVNFFMRHGNLESRAFLVVVVLTTVGFLWIVREFLMPVFWALVPAVLFRSTFQR